MKIRGLFPIPLFAVAGLVLGQDEFVIDNSANFTSVPNLPYLYGLSVPGLTPGSLITLFGSDLTSVEGVVVADGSPLPTELAGTSVSFSGVPAHLLAVANVNGREQINLQVSYDLPVPMPDPLCVPIVGRRRFVRAVWPCELLQRGLSHATSSLLGILRCTPKFSRSME